MILRLCIIGGFLLTTLGTWALIRPPSAQVDRLANGTLVATSAEVVTRSSPTAPVLPSPDLLPQDARLLEDTFGAVLEALGFGIGDAALRDQSSGALSGIGAVTGQSRDLQIPQLAQILITGLQERHEDAAIHAALSAAAAAGAVEVPAALFTTEGEIDTGLLLETVVLRAKVRIGAAEPAAPMDVRAYTVVPGDSLAGVAAKVYGDPTDFVALMQANADLLDHPAQIAVGMRLLVPPL